MNKEIGGYFEYETHLASKGEFYSNLIKVNNCRNALLYIVKSKKIKKLFIPSFLCESISLLCKRYGIDYIEYKISKSFKPLLKIIPEENEYVLVVNYYGQLTNDNIVELKHKYKRIIVDNSQAFFSKPIEGIDTIYSCRKFFGVPDGGYLSTDCLLNETIEQDDSENRLAHIAGRTKDCASDHYLEYRENEALIASLPLKLMSDTTKNLLCKIDYDYAKSRRDENYSYLNSLLEQYNDLKLKKTPGPYCYPFYIKNASKLREVLIANKIYVPLLWPYAFSHGGVDRELSENVVPIPCDQRYSLDEMDYIVKIIKESLDD